MRNTKRLAALGLAVSLTTAVTARAGTWTPLTHAPTFLNPAEACAEYHNARCARTGSSSIGGIENVNLLTDGRLLFTAIQVSAKGATTWVELTLTPDLSGSYVNGTWAKVASLPDAFSPHNRSGWGPSGFASAVLPDGRVIYEGGEDSGVSFALSNQGAIYDPVKNQWTVVAPPNFENLYPADPPDLPGFNAIYTYPRYPAPQTSELVDAIGDSTSAVLANGTFMLASKLSRQQALLDPTTLTWTLTGTGKNDVNSEEGWTLLPNGQLLTVDTDLDYWFGLVPSYQIGNSERYDPATGSWSSAGNTVSALSAFPDGEMGPAVLMADGVVFATGAEGANSLYNSNTGTWSAGPSFPKVTVNNRSVQLLASDVGAALLTNGNVLVAADTYGEGSPTMFFEFDGTHLIPEPSTPNSAFDGGAFFILLPSGQALEFDGSTDLEVYTPTPAANPPAMAPYDISVPSAVRPGSTYTVQGRLLNGVSQGAMEGDDWQMATNYPLVRITNSASGHVYYSRTFGFSSMAVANPNVASASFEVPKAQETGPSTLVVVTNGVPSAPVNITVL
jgi:hypothetical protein